MMRFLPVATNWILTFTFAGMGVNACGYRRLAIALHGIAAIGLLIPLLGPIADWRERRRKRRCSPLRFDEADPGTFGYFTIGPDGKLYPAHRQED